MTGYAKARYREKAKTENPTFTLDEEPDSMAPRDLKEAIWRFLGDSYGAYS